ncbi:MAG: two-component system response regulator, partial [Candidatus Competibacteraceae bacterium]|nr:two-component system response regulator [Candidatus Competibacteraceae bacterium]
LWGLPLELVEAVAFHHRPRENQFQGLSALTAVHAANALSHEFSLDIRLSTPTALDYDYLQTLGLAERVEDWRVICRKMLT